MDGRRARRGFGLASVLYAGAWLTNRSLRRVEGPSMLPSLADGDRVLVLPRRIRAPRVGDVVVFRDPRGVAGTMLKRVTAVRDDGLWVEGDNPGASTDSRVFGPIARTAVTHVAVLALPSASLRPVRP